MREVRDRISIIFNGQVPAKKNGRQFRKVRKARFTVPSEKHDEWHGDMLLEHGQILRRLEPPYEILARYWVGSFQIFDLSNCEESIHDWLVDAGVIVDDNAFELPRYTCELAGLAKDAPRVELIVSSLILSPAHQALKLLRNKDEMRSHVANLKAQGIKAGIASETRRLWLALHDFDEFNKEAIAQ